MYILPHRECVESGGDNEYRRLGWWFFKIADNVNGFVVGGIKKYMYINEIMWNGTTGWQALRRHYKQKVT